MNKYVFILFLSVFFFSCHSLVKDTFEDVKKKTVLNAVLQQDSIIKVHVSFPERIDGYIPDYINDARIEVSASEGWTETLSYIANGWYYSSYFGKAGVSYTCEISVPEYETVTATTTIPEPTQIRDVRFTKHAGHTEEGMVISAIHFSIHNKSDKELYWELFFWREIGLYDFEEWESSYIEMLPGQDKVLLNEAFPLTVFCNKRMNDTYDVTFYFSENFVDVSNMHDFYIELRSTDKSYYDYQKQKYLYDTADDTGLGSSVQTYPLYSNVTNGYGIFTSYSTAFEVFNYSNYLNE